MVTFGQKPLPTPILKNRAESHWQLWRLIFDGGMDYGTVFYQMTPAQIDEANAALDYLIELQNKRE